MVKLKDEALDHMLPMIIAMQALLIETLIHSDAAATIIAGAKTHFASVLRNPTQKPLGEAALMRIDEISALVSARRKPS